MFTTLFLLECMYLSVPLVRKIGLAVFAVKVGTVWVSNIQAEEDMKVGYNSAYEKEELCTEIFTLGAEPLPPTLEHLRNQKWILTLTETHQLVAMIRSKVIDPARYDKLVWLSNNRITARAA